jgi:hypothetical protein
MLIGEQPGDHDDAEGRPVSRESLNAGFVEDLRELVPAPATR